MAHFLTFGDMKCVDGVLKCTFSTNTVAQTDNEISISVKTRYLPSKGIVSEVEGIVSIKTDRKKMSETSVKIVSVTLSLSWKYELS